MRSRIRPKNMHASTSGELFFLCSQIYAESKALQLRRK